MPSYSVRPAARADASTVAELHVVDLHQLAGLEAHTRAAGETAPDHLHVGEMVRAFRDQLPLRQPEAPDELGAQVALDIGMRCSGGEEGTENGPACRRS